MKFINRSVLPTEKLGKFLTSTFGIGKLTTIRVCRQLGLQYNSKLGALVDSKIRYIELVFSKFVLGLDLQRKVQNCISDKVRLGGFSGLRLSQGLPSRGQRTKTNAQTCKKIYKKQTNVSKKTSFKKK